MEYLIRLIVYYTVVYTDSKDAFLTISWKLAYNYAMYEKCHRFWHGKLWYSTIFTFEHSGFTCKLARTKWICRALKDFILNIYELLTHRNDRKSISNTDERNSAPIVEEHVRNKRRRFTTREIYLLWRPRVYILTRKNEREDREKKKESSSKGCDSLSLWCSA